MKSTFYIGVTNNLLRRIREHKDKTLKGFTSRYNLSELVYFEEYTDINEALRREKQLKNWKRKWKIELIKKANPSFRDLYKDAESSSA
jgi:putative endonuclease